MTVPAGPSLSIAPNVAPMSGTGSDIHEFGQGFDFGDFTVGADASNWAQSLARDVLVAVVAGFAIKTLLNGKK